MTVVPVYNVVVVPDSNIYFGIDNYKMKILKNDQAAV